MRVIVDPDGKNAQAGGLRRGLDHRPTQGYIGPARRHPAGQGRLAAGRGRLGRRDLSHQLREVRCTRDGSPPACPGPAGGPRSARSSIPCVRRRAAALAACASPRPRRAPSRTSRPAANGAETCVACHGAAGISADPGMPSLAGQPGTLPAVAAGLLPQRHRRAPSCARWPRPLRDEEIRNLAAYSASRRRPSRPPAGADPAMHEAGQQARRGTAARPATGRLRRGQAAPRIAHQREDYLLKALRDFKSGRAHRRRCCGDGRRRLSAQRRGPPGARPLRGVQALTVRRRRRTRCQRSQRLASPRGVTLSVSSRSSRSTS